MFTTCDNFSYRKYNDLVMQLGISKRISKKFKESAFIMKKQTKVLLAASLFTLGASFSSMAALKNGTWVLNEDG